ncbi:MAG: hypothetical protein AAF226_16715, partial [Verrucomicrobiota bacterium]
MASEYDWRPVANPNTGSVFKVETRNIGWWILLALVVSLVLHMILLVLMRGWDANFGGVRKVEEIVFRTRKESQAIMDRKELDRLLAQDVADPVIPEDRIEPDKLSDLDVVDNSLDEFDLMEQMKAESVRLAPAEAPQVFSDAIAPQIPAAAMDLASDATTLDMSDVFSEDLQDMRNRLVEESSAVSINQPVLKIDATNQLSQGVNTDDFFKDAAKRAFGNEADSFIEGYASLDGLLARADGLPTGEEKFVLPTDILFEYNEFELKEESTLSLMKLAFLIETNPDSIFRIEGHTDTFG